MNSAWESNVLCQEYLPLIPDVHERLRADPPARVADIACGAGWSSVAIARGYPKCSVDGFALDESSISLARKNAAEAGLTDRVRFEIRDASDPSLADEPRRGAYNLVTIFEASTTCRARSMRSPMSAPC